MALVFDRATLLTMLSALVFSVLCLFPDAQSFFPIRIICMGMHVADTLFHEMGHTLAGWFLGYPSIPSIMTLFGADQAGGITYTPGRSWFVQILGFGGMAGMCYWLREHYPALFYPSLAVSAIFGVLAFTPYTALVISYMGHGGSMLTGGFLLWRGWLYVDARGGYERWLNAFFGFTLVLKNMLMCYQLAFVAGRAEEYSGKLIGGSIHHDFAAMVEHMPNWTVSGIALVTFVLGIVILCTSFGLALIGAGFGEE